MRAVKAAEGVLLAAIALSAASALLWWRVREIPLPQAAIAGRDGATGRKAVSEAAKIGEFFESFSALAPGEEAAKFPDWPQFRGPARDNAASSEAELDYDLENAKVLWRIPLGEGYSAPAIYKNRVYILDYDEEKEADSLRCFSLADGRELWRRWYAVKVRRNHGKSRTTAGVFDGAAVTIGPMGHVMCADAISGDFRWGFDLAGEFGSEVPQWYCGQCPAADSGEAVVAPAGKDVLMMGVDLKSGRINWKTPNPGGLKMSHSSVMPMEILGKRQFVYCAAGGIAGVSAEEGDRGRLLWTSREWKPNVFAPSPVKISENRIFLTAGYGAGGAILEISNDGAWDAKIVKSWKAKNGPACEQQTPVIFNGRLFTILPKDAGGLNSLLAACDMSKDCEIAATSPRGTRFGIGPYMSVNDRLLVLDDDGRLYVLRDGADSITVESSRKFFDGGDSWGPMAFSDGRLILRDSKEMACLDIRRRKE